MLLIKDAAFWRQVREDPAWAPMVRRIKELYADSYEKNHPSISYSLRHLYFETGSRNEFEAVYFKRRFLMAEAAILALIYPEEEHYLTETIDAMFAIMDEYCWALPAHTGDDFAANESFIDLMAAETGIGLAECAAALGDRIPKLVKDRIRYEVNRRITEGMRKRSYWWETNCTNNWAAVCAGAVGMTFMYLDPESFELYRPRIMGAMKNFLTGYPEDGTCLEGVGYWHYGFGYFCMFADLLLRYTEGRVNLFDDPKVKNIACFMQNTFLMGQSTTSYADGFRKADHNVDYGMQHLLHTMYPKDVSLLPDAVSGFSRGWTYEYRDFVFFDPALQKTAKEPVLRDSRLRDAGQVILHRAGYSLAAKAGHNDEPHNHNDVGCFILATKDGQILEDLGSGLYTRDYFDAATRYLRFCNNSKSHNVPIINGEGQKAGAEYNGTIEFLGEDAFEISFAGAYGLPELRKLTRNITAQDHEAVIRDAFEGDVTEFIERLVTPDPPTFLARVGHSLPTGDVAPADEIMGIRLNGVTVTFGDSVKEIRFSKEEHLCHRTADMEPVYCIDLVTDPAFGGAEITLTVDSFPETKPQKT